MLSQEECAAVIGGIAAAPEGGGLIPGSGGLRKRRIALPGRGKRGGARVITLFVGEEWPVYAVFIFAKNERENMSPDQKRRLLRLVETIKSDASARRRVQ